MSTESDKPLPLGFLLFLTIVALVINSFCFGMVHEGRRATMDKIFQAQAQVQQQQLQAQQTQVQLQQQQQDRERQQELEHDKEAAALKAARNAAEKHRQYLARYLNPGFSRHSGMEEVAVAVATENGTFNQSLAQTLADHLKSGSVEPLTSFFKPAFVSDGLINDGFNDAGGISGKLELGNSLDAFLLARQKVDYARNPSLDNVLTATMKLEISALPVSGNLKAQSWTFIAHGVGFTQADARASAEERIIKQITIDTNLLLSATSQ